jgi:ABC-type sugar transport system ATPase subunit
MAPSTSSVVLKDIRKSFGAVDVIKGVDLRSSRASSASSSARPAAASPRLLRLISGLEEATSGVIEIGGADVTDAEPSARGIAMVFQATRSIRI